MGFFVSFCSVLNKQARVTCENERVPFSWWRVEQNPEQKIPPPPSPQQHPPPLHPNNNNKTKTNNNETKKQQQKQWKLNW